MIKGLVRIIFVLMMGVLPARYGQAAPDLFEINSEACEKKINGESKASVRVRTVDKAVFSGVRKLPAINEIGKVLEDSELNVLVYRLVDEYVEDLNFETIDTDDGRVCAKVHGWLNPDNISAVKQEFVKNDAPVSENEPEKIAQVVEEVEREVSAKPNDPENLALVHIKKLQYYNGSETSRFSTILQDKLKDNPYFYLTQEADLADYVLTPKVMKAKVDLLDAGHKRLQMVVSIEISGLEKDAVDEYQNRFVLFGAEENEQQIASRLIRKLLENACDGVRRKIEHNEQLKFEQKTFGKTISQ